MQYNLDSHQRQIIWSKPSAKDQAEADIGDLDKLYSTCREGTNSESRLHLH